MFYMHNATSVVGFVLLVKFCLMKLVFLSISYLPTEIMSIRSACSNKFVLFFYCFVSYRFDLSKRKSSMI